MFSSLIDSASQFLFGGEPASAPATGAANDGGPGALATGTPTAAQANEVYGGQYDGPPPKLEPVLGPMVAKIKAQQELSKMLEVDGGGQNGVSKEEYDRLVQMYADIDLGKTDIKFDTKDMDPDKAAEMKQLALKD